VNICFIYTGLHNIGFHQNDGFLRSLAFAMYRFYAHRYSKLIGFHNYQISFDYQPSCIMIPIMISIDHRLYSRIRCISSDYFPRFLHLAAVTTTTTIQWFTFLLAQITFTYVFAQLRLYYRSIMLFLWSKVKTIACFCKKKRRKLTIFSHWILVCLSIWNSF